MRLYNKYYASGYDELITYYPKYYREVYEMVEILKANGRLLDNLEENIEKVYLNCFIDYADEETITILEKFLDIGLNRSRKLEERRRLVKSFFVGFGKVSASMLEEMIKSYTGAGVSSRFEPCDDKGNNMLYLNFERGEETTLYMSDINLLLGKKIPAHIAWQAAITYPFPIGVGIKRTHYRYGYDLTGTKPEIAMLGTVVNRAAVTQARSSRGKITHRQAAEADELTGTLPDIALLGSLVAVRGVVEAEAGISIAEYKTAAETAQEAGQWPDITAIGSQHSAGGVIGAQEESHTAAYTPTGVKPDISSVGSRQEAGSVAGADKRSYASDYEAAGVKPEAVGLGAETKINAGAGVKFTDCGVDYIYCGTRYTQS